FRYNDTPTTAIYTFSLHDALPIFEAERRAPIVIIEGEVVGRIIASDRIELREHARVFGDLETAVLIIEEGALFEGQTRPVAARTAEGARADRLPEPTPDLSTSLAAT